MQDLNFVAIDFETANEQRGSACQVGMTKVIGGQLVEATGWYTIPPAGLDSFSPWNMRIHKITPELVADGHTWSESTEAIHDFAEGLPLVAHNSSFDRSVYLRSCEAAMILPFEYTWHCSLKLTKRLLVDGPTRLVEVAKHLGIETPNHHDATHDSTVAAKIVTRFAQLHSIYTPAELWPAIGAVPSRSLTVHSASVPPGGLVQPGRDGS